jgi:4-hydroxy-L-threonine phosphate dehydrogenase PdxA
MNNKIILVTGDPNSINSEIIYKSWKKINKKLKSNIYLISNFNLLKKQFIKLKIPINIKKVENIYSKTKNTNTLKIIDLDIKLNKNPFKIKSKSASKFVIDSLNYAHSLASKGKVKGMINCAINKNLLLKEKIGVTEFLSSKCGVKDDSEAMLIYNSKLSICPITTHIDIKDVSKVISKKKIINKVKTIVAWHRKIFKKKPKIAILGLNPHNAEMRMNTEEKKIIIPSINYLKKLNININGPFSADTMFINQYKKYDIVIGMFHDQIITPFKTLFKFDAINVTLGLKYLRVSPDHGTALDLVGKRKANPVSLIKCIEFIDKFAK